MSGNSSKLLNAVGLLASCCVACACTGGTALPFVAAASGIAGNIAAEHFSKLFSLSQLYFFGEKQPAGLHAELRKSLIAAATKALEQIKREYVNPVDIQEVKEILEAWQKQAAGILENTPTSVSAWNSLTSGEKNLQQTLSELGIELYVPNENYEQSEFRTFFLENFPVYFASHFQEELEKNQQAWLTWQVLQLNNQRKALTEIAEGNANIWQAVRELKELTVENFASLRESFSKAVNAAVQHISLAGQVLIFCNAADRPAVQRQVVRELEPENIPFCLDSQNYSMGEYGTISQKILSARKSVIVFSKNFSRNDKRLLSGFIDEYGTNKLLPLRLDATEVFKEFDHFIDLSASADAPLKALVQQLTTEFGIAPARPTYPPLEEKYVDVTALPHRGASDHLFGRQAELSLLDEAWDDPETHVISFVAQGGVGKSALISRWVADLAKDNYRGAGRVLATSFYSQGTTDRIASSDLWMHKALHWFGETEYDTRSPWDKGKRLAQLVNEHRTLLLFDGLEPMQEGGHVGKGTVKDPALATLIRQLARLNRGLCVITTREALSGFERFDKYMRSKSLEIISDEAGVHILRFAGRQGISGTDSELAAAVRSFGNHAFAINLLGSYLYAQPGHKAEFFKEIPDLPDVPVEKGKHARRVIAALGNKLAKDGKHEAVKLLESLGFFDRPVPREVLKVIADFDDLSEAIADLRERKLVYPRLEHAQEMVDCHPLVREHFEEVLQKEFPALWQRGHTALYEYYKALPKKEYPDTLEEMEPLFLAVRHGCRAGLQQKALEDVYWFRINRLDDFFITNKLGAFSSGLSVVSCFFKHQWDMPAPNLPEIWKAGVLSWAGFFLRALGKLVESAYPMSVCLQSFVKIKDWEEALVNACNLSELSLTIGDVHQAINYGKKSMEYAERSGEMFEIASLTTYGYALHQSGNFAEAHRLFAEAEQLQKQDYFNPLLYSLRGFQYCDVLLNMGRHEEVLDRAKKTLLWYEEKYPLLSIALDKLNIGIAHSFLAQTAVTDINFESAMQYLDHAVEGLRKAGTQEFIPLALLARSAYHRTTKNYPAALDDLEEVLDIAEPGGMRLHLTDYHLEMARLCLAMSEGQPEKLAEAKEHTELAAQLVEDTGYHRRDGEVAELREKLKNLPA